MTSPIQTCGQLQHITSLSETTRPQNRAAPTQSGDTVSLSKEGRLLSGFFEGLGVEYTPGSDVRLGELESGLEGLRQGFESDVGAMFLENGIPSKPPVELTSDSSGAVLVNGSHPYKERIEKLFAEDPQLSNEFRKISSLTSITEAIKEYSEFARRYEEDPNAAIEEYAYLFEKRPEKPFVMAIGEA